MRRRKVSVADLEGVEPGQYEYSKVHPAPTQRRPAGGHWRADEQEPSASAASCSRPSQVCRSNRLALYTFLTTSENGGRIFCLDSGGSDLPVSDNRQYKANDINQAQSGDWYLSP